MSNQLPSVKQSDIDKAEEYHRQRKRHHLRTAAFRAWNNRLHSSDTRPRGKDFKNLPRCKMYFDECGSYFNFNPNDFLLAIGGR